MAYESGLEKRKSFIKFGREEKKGRKRSNFIRGKSTCKGTRLVTTRKGKMLTVAGTRQI